MAPPKGQKRGKKQAAACDDDEANDGDEIEEVEPKPAIRSAKRLKMPEDRKQATPETEVENPRPVSESKQLAPALAPAPGVAPEQSDAPAEPAGSAPPKPLATPKATPKAKGKAKAKAKADAKQKAKAAPKKKAMGGKEYTQDRRSSSMKKWLGFSWGHFRKHRNLDLHAG